VASQRDRKDSLALKHVSRILSLNVSEERMESGKAMVSRARQALSFSLQMIQECFHQGNIDLFEPQLVRGDSPYVSAES
jgi:hypothetical protein